MQKLSLRFVVLFSLLSTLIIPNAFASSRCIVGKGLSPFAQSVLPLPPADPSNVDFSYHNTFSLGLAASAAGTANERVASFRGQQEHKVTQSIVIRALKPSTTPGTSTPFSPASPMPFTSSPSTHAPGTPLPVSHADMPTRESMGSLNETLLR